MIRKGKVYDDKVSKIKINEKFLSSAYEPMKAIIAYYGLKAGTECWWENDEPTEKYDNLECLLTKPLKIGFQCSNEHINIVKKWFKDEPKIMNDDYKKPDNCAASPETATIQSTYNYINLTRNSNVVSISYEKSGFNMREENDGAWSFVGKDVFEIQEDTIKLISSEGEIKK